MLMQPAFEYVKIGPFLAYSFKICWWFLVATKYLKHILCEYHNIACLKMFLGDWVPLQGGQEEQKTNQDLPNLT